MKEVIDLSSRLMAFAATLANEEEDLVNEAARVADAYEAMERRVLIASGRGELFKAEHTDWSKVDAAESAENEFLRLRTEITELRQELERVKMSILQHFQDEHLAGDGPEIDRWRRENATLRGQAEVAGIGVERLVKLFEASAKYHRDCTLCAGHVVIANELKSALAGKVE